MSIDFYLNYIFVVVGTFLVLISPGAVGVLGKSLAALHLRFFGDISYSLYLYHWPIAVFINYMMLDEMSGLFVYFGFFTSIILGFISYKFLITHKMQLNSNGDLYS